MDGLGRVQPLEVGSSAPRCAVETVEEGSQGGPGQLGEGAAGAETEGVELEGIATHFADIEDTTDHRFAGEQLEGLPRPEERSSTRVLSRR